MKYFSHSGVLIPKPYETKGFHIKIKGEEIALTPHQEEMAVAWVKKLGTDYVNDPVFRKNFFTDFFDALGMKDKPLEPEDFDFSEIKKYVEEEQQSPRNGEKNQRASRAHF